MKIMLQYLLLSMGLLLTSPVFSEQKDKHVQHQKALDIPEAIKPILTQEMLLFEKAMKGLLSSITTGNWHKTVEIAKQVEASYIFKQQLSKEQREHLHHILPKRFVHLDHSFHQYAGMLAHAAEVKNADVMNFYFYKMADSCTQCHAEYAKEKFPGFVAKGTHSH